MWHEKISINNVETCCAHSFINKSGESESELRNGKIDCEKRAPADKRNEWRQIKIRSLLLSVDALEQQHSAMSSSAADGEDDGGVERMLQTREPSAPCALGGIAVAKINLAKYSVSVAKDQMND